MIVKVCAVLLLFGLAIADDFEYDKPTYVVLKGQSRFARAVVENTGRNCTKEGLMCDDCKKLVYCQDVIDSFEKHEAEICSDKTTCHEASAECSTAPNPKCDPAVTDFKFQCKQAGVFPHPYDCFSYVICIATTTDNVVTYQTFTQTCKEKGFSYDPLTTLCSKKLVNDSCTPFVPPCVKVGDVTIIPGNNQLYSRCFTGTLPEGSTETKKPIVPFLFACNGNFIYNGTRCVDPATQVAPKPPSPVDTNNNCLATGLYPDLTNCRYYFNCVYVARPPARAACPAGNRFDPTSKRCVEFAC